ncbi:hypothetical protein, partial [Caldithrix abyssi]
MFLINLTKFYGIFYSFKILPLKDLARQRGIDLLEEVFQDSQAATKINRNVRKEIFLADYANNRRNKQIILRPKLS